MELGLELPGIPIELGPELAGVIIAAMNEEHSKEEFSDDLSDEPTEQIPVETLAQVVEYWRGATVRREPESGN
jgi:hypothetical protein